MIKRRLANSREDPFELMRFVQAQDGVYKRAVAELRGGRKRSHWMWFIFPQIVGLGRSSTSMHYAIKSRKEALEYLAHPILGTRLVECANAVLGIDGSSASEIFGFPDDVKLKSSMTLFAEVSDADSPFVRVLEKYFGGERDNRTLQLMNRL